MTVAIAPIMAKLPTQGASTSSISPDDTALSGADFASLLLGQLSAGAELQQVGIGNPATSAASTVAADTPLPGSDFASLLLAGAELQQAVIGNSATSTSTSAATSATAAATTTDLIDTSTSPQDTAMQLAMLGMITPQQASKITTDAAGTDTDTLLIGNDKKTSSIFLASTSVDQKAALPDTALETDTKTRAELPIASVISDKAAKFAVPGMDAPVIKSVTPDSSVTQASTTVALPHNQTGSTTPIPGTSLRVDTPVRDASWPGDFTQKVVWLASNDQKFAQLTLNPPQMGPIEISLNINKESASAYFMSPNAEVREAIETALPRLREMLAGVGIELGQANVSAQSHQESGGQNTQGGAPRWIADKDILGNDSRLNQTIITQRGNGLVDIFA